MVNRMVLAARTALIVAAACSLPSCQTTGAKARSLQNEPETPLGPAGKRYVATVEALLGPIWYRLVRENSNHVDLGKVTVRFEIPAAGGKVRNVRVISHTRSETDVLVAMRAIELLRVPRIPAQVQVEIQSNHIVMEPSFAIYPKP